MYTKRNVTNPILQQFRFRPTHVLITRKTCRLISIPLCYLYNPRKTVFKKIHPERRCRATGNTLSTQLSCTLVVCPIVARFLETLHRPLLDGTVTSAATGALDRVQHTPRPIFHEVWHVANGVTVRDQVPAPSAVAVVVEPRPKYQIRSDTQEGTAARVSKSRTWTRHSRQVSIATHTMTSQVKKPQEALLSPPLLSSPFPSRFPSHACFVCQVSRKTSPSFSGP